jgi:hypothetical protein
MTLTSSADILPKVDLDARTGGDPAFNCHNHPNRDVDVKVRYAGLIP